MNGLLFYQRRDYKKSKTYIEWLIDVGSKNNLDIKLMFAEDFYDQGILEIKDLDFVINRSRNANLSTIFELNDIRVFNQSEVTYMGNNKLAAFKYAKNIGYPFAKVLLNWYESEPFISKPIMGHGGEGIYRSFENVLYDEKRFQQNFIKNFVGDIRFYIINNKIIDAVIRYPKESYLSNFSKGGDFERYSFTEAERKFVEGFIKSLSCDYIGLDFFLLENGKLLFNELEDVVGSRMLSHLGDNQTTNLYIRHILKTLRENKQ